MPVIKKEREPIGFLLKAIEMLDFSLNLPQAPDFNLIGFHFDIKLEHKLNNENKLVIVIVSVDILNQDRSCKLGSISSNCIFEVEKFEEYVDTKKNIQHFPDDFLLTLNSIAISTTRGTMFAQFRGTFLHNAFLPIIDPKSFVTQK